MNTSIERIISDPKICSGKPCVKGTRIPVHIILDLLAVGESFEGIKKAYPNITDEDIKACLNYAAILADEEAGVTVWRFLPMKTFLNPLLIIWGLSGIMSWWWNTHDIQKILPVYQGRRHKRESDYYNPRIIQHYRIRGRCKSQS